tara:strand:+ start:633 stop:1595 length:963 start_codon:yes stop_codon:yes gene_type:complete
MPNYNGVWSLSTQFQYAATWNVDNLSPTRAHFSGGENASGTLLNVKEIITTSSTGNSIDFGDLVTPTRRSAAFSSSTRGVIAGGRNGVHNVIQYFSIASSGDSLDFGDLLSALEFVAGLSNSTRGIAAGGSSSTNVIQFVTIATTGNATDFGDLSGTRSTAGGLASTTRGVVCGGIDGSTRKDIMEYVTIASAGNVTDFGNLSQAKAYIEGGCTSNSTRGLIMGGSRGNDDTVDEVEYITISSTGDVTDFGNLSAGRMKGAAATTGDRAVIGGGQGDNTSDAVNIIEFFTITSTGNATDFGDLAVAKTELQGVSNGHGGL